MTTGSLVGTLKSIILLGLVSLPVVGVAANGAANKPAVRRVMLPASVTPEHYRIDVTPDPGAMVFKGSVDIDVTVHAATSTIVLNSADIVIDSAAASGDTKVAAIQYDTGVQTATLQLAHTLKPGAYTLKLAYHGKIYQQASGLFALDYDTPQGKARALFTQFENSDARRFVPSWDEPGRKATFEVTATVPAGQMALSNMPAVSTEALGGNLKRVHFAATPKMSSYLLFFGMGDFERVHRSVDGVDVGVVVKRGDTAAAEFAIDAAAHILPYYNSYFGTPFPLPKLDLIAAPGSSQFFGAMENWGAIFYFERDLLIDSRISTERDKEEVYVVVAHEMAHQWFGDLVTMAWWDDLWLNEGFASWMENKVTDHFHPEWKIWLQTLRQKQSAMEVDAHDGTHPIITPIKDVLQASSAFDTITYSKGAAVIRMLESYLGEDSFRAGVQRYMHDHAYGNTVTDDLWTEMDKGSQRPITRIAHDFTLQAGVPMIEEGSGRCRDNRLDLQVTQGHFAIDPESTGARIWHVPVMVAPIAGQAVTAMVSGPAPTTLHVPGCGVVVINTGQTAYFRTRYSKEGLAAIASGYGALLSDDQLGIMNDTSALAYAGEEPMSVLLELAKDIPSNADPVVSSALVSLLRRLDRLYDGLPTQEAFRAYARTVANPIFARVGWDKQAGEGDTTALLRSNLIAGLSEFNDTPVIGEARKRFARFLTDPASLDAGSRRTVLAVVALHAELSSWDQLHGMAKSAKTEMERQQFYELLAMPENGVLVQRALDLSLSGEPPATITPDIISSASFHHPEMAADFAMARWNDIAPLIEPASQERFIPNLVSDASDLKLIDKLDNFADGHIPPDARQDLRKSESNIRFFNVIRRDRLPEIDQWIQSHQG